MTQRITMEAIARQSGVSLATVSRVLQGKSGINKDTRRRVLDIARDLGYHKRVLYEGSGSQAIHHIGVLVKAQANGDQECNPFYAPVVAGIEMACRKLQINLLYATVPVSPDNHPQERPRMLFEDQLDGVLLVGAFADQTIGGLLQPQRGAVVLINDYANASVCDAVLINNFRGAYDAVDHLIRCGHRHIGLVGPDDTASPGLVDRRKGGLQALRDHGIDEAYFSDCHPTTESAVEVLPAFLRRHPQLTAVFCVNDATAVGVMHATRALGRAVPDDLSIIGFDNLDLAQHIIPPLTTMHVDKVSMGRLAVQTFVHRAEYPSCGPVTTMLQPTLIERETVQPLVRSNRPNDNR